MLIYDCTPAPNPWRVRIFLKEKGIKVPMTQVDVMAGESRSPEFMAKNTLGETPVLLLDDGRYLTESMAICRYFEALNPEPRLMGADATECAFVEMWTRRAEQQLMNPIANFAQHSFEFFADKIDQIPAFAESQKQLMVKKWAWLDQEMADGRPYLAGDTFTVADIAGMAALKICDYAELVINDGLTHAKTWEARVRGRESWAA